MVLRASVPMASCAHNGNSDFLSGPLIAKSFVAKASFSRALLLER